MLTALDAQRTLTSTSTWEYDYANHLVKETNAIGNSMTYIYDALGRKTSFTDVKGGQATVHYSTTYTYDALGRLLVQITPFEQSTGGYYNAYSKYYYDAAGRVTLQKQSNNVPGENLNYRQTGNSYDSRGRLVLTTAYDGTTPESYTKYEYDGVGNRTDVYTGMASSSSTTGAAHTECTYDRYGNILTQTDALGQTETFVYDLNGKLTEKTDRNGNTTSYTYDPLGQLLTATVTDPSNTVIGLAQSSYTATGMKQSDSNGAFTTEYNYDSAGRLSTETETGNVVKSHTYDIGGNRTGFTLTKGGSAVQNLNYTYDNLNRLATVREDGVQVAAYTYDANGNRSSLTNSNGTAETYSYNLANAVTLLENKKGQSILSSYAYTYYLDGNQKTKTDHNGKATSYSYDGLGRLSSEAETGGNTMAYTYDLFGNRSTLTVTGTESYTVSYSYDLNNRLLSDEKVTGGVTATTSYTYDANGNQLIKETSTLAPTGTATNPGVSLSGDIDPVAVYGYNGFNQMVSAYDNGHTMSYSYRPDGLRLSKMVDNVTTTHIWDGQNIAAETGTDGTITTNYIRGVNLVASKKSEGLSYYLYNAHGDVVQLTDTTGTVSRIYDYDAFGNERVIAGQNSATDTNPFRYCGEYFDKETGTIYLRARYYDPVTSRMLSEDPARAGLNWYTYCGNNPIAFIDPYGLDAVLINKRIDNASKTGIEHMGAFFQDSNNDWWFLFYGDKVKYQMVDDNSIFGSMDSMNEWLVKNADLNPDNPYQSSVYVKGDFTASDEGARGLLDKYNQSIENGTAKGWAYYQWLGVTNNDYRGLTNNCSQVTMDLFYRGTLPNGTNVGDYAASLGYRIGAIPNANMSNMQSAFYNNAYNIDGFNTAMQTQRYKYESKNAFVQWWYSGLRNNINTIS